MAAKILAFDPNRKVPLRHYVPMAMCGRLLQMPVRNSEVAANQATSEDLCSSRMAPTQKEFKEFRKLEGISAK